MLIEHLGKQPTVHESAFVAPTAVVCGDVTIGPNAQVAFGAVIVAEGSSVVVGTQSIVRENAVIRATPEHLVKIGDCVLVGPHAALYGCTAWWFWMLILGAFCCLSAGVTEIVRHASNARERPQNPKSVSPQATLGSTQVEPGLPAADTGEIVTPPSVTEATTKQLNKVPK